MDSATGRTGRTRPGDVVKCDFGLKITPWPDRAKTKADANRDDLIGRAKEKDKPEKKEH